MKILLPLLLLIAPLHAAWDLAPGEPFPNLTLDDIATGKGTPVRSQIKGKTILHIFASW